MIYIKNVSKRKDSCEYVVKYLKKVMLGRKSKSITINGHIILVDASAEYRYYLIFASDEDDLYYIKIDNEWQLITDENIYDVYMYLQNVVTNDMLDNI